MSRYSFVERGLPNMATGTFAQSASKSASSTSKLSYTPTVTPPSADGNPNVWRANHLPDGLIYIIVGGAAGAIFILILLWYGISRYMSRRAAKKTMYETNNIQWRDTPSSGLYDRGDEKELYQSLLDRGDKSESKPKKSLIGLLGGGSQLGSSASYDTLANTEGDDDMIGGAYQERFNPVQDVIPNHFPRSSLFISPTMEVVQQNRQSKNLGRSNHFQNLSMTSLQSASESSSNYLDKPERTASPERKPKTYGRYQQGNRSSLGVAEHPQTRASLEVPTGNNHHRKQSSTTPSGFLDDLLEGKNESV